MIYLQNEQPVKISLLNFIAKVVEHSILQGCHTLGIISILKVSLKI